MIGSRGEARAVRAAARRARPAAGRGRARQLPDRRRRGPAAGQAPRDHRRRRRGGDPRSARTRGARRRCPGAVGWGIIAPMSDPPTLPPRLSPVGHHQDLPLGRRQRRHRPRRAARRDPRGARRERRRQVDADEDHLRRRPPGRRHDPLERRARHHRQSGARAPARHRHGVPALLAVRDADRRREHRARARPCRAPGDLAARIREVSTHYGLPLDPDRHVHTMSVGERQRVEIVRCLLQDPRLLIMDEPTSVLTPQAVEKLFETLRRLAAEGCSILYISHKLDEIRALCHRATVLRAGRVTGTCDPRQESATSLARMMIGGDLPHPEHRAGAGDGRRRAGGRPTCRCPPTTRSAPTLHEINLAVRAGEIVGIAGVSGNGQKELLAALSGERTIADAAAIRIDGAPGRHARRGPATRARLRLRARGAAGPRRGARDVAGRERAADRAPARARAQRLRPFRRRARLRAGDDRRVPGQGGRRRRRPRAACPAAICRSSSSAARSGSSRGC